MKPFVLRVCLFCLPIALLLTALEGAMRVIPGDYPSKRALFEAGLDEIEVLILGNSHAYMGLNPGGIEGEGFNLGSTAQMHYQDLLLFERYAPQMPALRQLVLSVSVASLGMESKGLPKTYDRRFAYALFWDLWSPLDFWERHSLRAHSYTVYYTVRDSVSRLISYARDESLVEFGPDGWFKTSDQLDVDKTGRDVGSNHDRYYQDEIVDRNLARIRELLTIAKQEEVDVLLLSPPMWRTYSQSITPGRHDRMVRELRALAASHDTLYLDLTADRRFVEDDFYNGDHLRARGADKLTGIVQEALAPHGD